MYPRPEFTYYLAHSLKPIAGSPPLATLGPQTFRTPNYPAAPVLLHVVSEPEASRVENPDVSKRTLSPSDVARTEAKPTWALCQNRQNPSGLDS